jgi:hypothetical protein
MKHLPEYNIHSFNWVKEDNTLYGISGTLWDTLGYYQFPFPNDRKQFKVVNPDTDGFRVFTFVTSFENTEGMLEYEFASEDGIKCRILIEPGTAGHTEITHSNEHWNEVEIENAYKNYCDAHPNAEKTFMYEGSKIEVRKMTKEEFLNESKTDAEFADMWFYDDAENTILFRDEISYEDSRPDILPD